jgi:hypothetical protein
VNERKPGDYQPVPSLAALHIHTFDDGKCTRCDIPLADWQQELHSQLAHIALDEGPDCGCGLGAALCRDLEDGA